MTLPKLLETYLDLGFHLLPIAPGDKVPYFEFAPNGVYSASNDRDVIKQWYSSGPPGLNFGIACGTALPEGGYLAVVDVDDYKEDGRRREDLDLPYTATQFTQSGGAHFFYRSDAPIGNGSLAPGVDCKGLAGYICVEPSVGARGSYIWDTGAHISDTPLAHLPAWAIKAPDRPRPVDTSDDDPANTVLGAAFRFMGWLGEFQRGKRYARCPWADTHSNGTGLGGDSSSVLLPATDTSRFGAFVCKHSHCDGRSSLDAWNECSEEAKRAAHREVPMPARTVDVAIDPDEWDTVTSTGITRGNITYKMTKEGAVYDLTLANVATILTFAPWEGVIAYDEMGEQPVVIKQAPIERTPTAYPRPWSDNDDSQVSVWIQRSNVPMNVSSKLVCEAANTVAKTNRINHLTAYLDGLKHDGTPRIDRWLVDYCNAKDSEYVREVGRMWMLSAVARAYAPGCQADYVLVLEGEQRTGKSTALRLLGGRWFTDDLGDVTTKDAPERIRGNWVVEISEMAGILIKETSVVKGFITRREDNYREAYGRRGSKFPRRCVFAGTVNESQYLNDPTGGMRYWCVMTDSPNLRKLAEDRDQLWAEAVARYKAKETWYPIGQDFFRIAKEEQERRRLADPWETTLRRALDGCNLCVPEQAFDLLAVNMSNRDMRAQARLIKSLQVLGFRPTGDGAWKRVVPVTELRAVQSA